MVKARLGSLVGAKLGLTESSRSAGGRGRSSSDGWFHGSATWFV